MSTRSSAFSLVLLLMAASGTSQAQLLDKINPGDFVAPICPALFDMTAADKPCAAKTAEIDKLASDEKACTAQGFKFEPAEPAKAATADQPAVPAKNASCKASEAPMPTCRPLPPYTATLKDGKCAYAKSQPTSLAGNFVGDCLRVDGIPPGVNVKSDDHFVVTAQRKVGDDEDRILTVVPAEKRELLWIPSLTFTCGSRGGPTRELSANALLDAGARRYGFAFGALSLPFKYFRKEGAFVTGIPVGMYGGYRWGQIGSAYTLAFGATLGSVKADTLDANDKTKVTGTADVMAIGTTIGLIFDITKSKDTRPFKIGLFYGSDRVSKDQTTINYKYNKRPWLAFQVGYDFTEN